jgi:ABC-2 type transport system ATP-binding protein
VREASFTVPAGSVTAFVGPNGAGKTTTLRMLCGLIRPTHGTIRIGDRPIEGGPDGIPCRLRALVERPAFYESLTAFENLFHLARLTTDVEPSEVDGCLERLGLSAARDRQVAGFSTGMLQRLALAHCLVGTPSLVVLDEPTSGLDPEFRVQVRDLFREMRATGTVTLLISSHLLWEIQEVADRLVLIREGRVRLEGALSDLLSGASAHRFSIRATPVDAMRNVIGPRLVRQDGGTFTVEIDREAVPELVESLVRNGGRVYEVREERSSLEDLYLRTLEGANPS